MARGRSNAAAAAELVVSEKAVSKHIANIFLKLDLAPSDDDNRRVCHRAAGAQSSWSMRLSMACSVFAVPSPVCTTTAVVLPSGVTPSRVW
jgi:DNA-binding NarL/FixJ family response regulator